MNRDAIRDAGPFLTSWLEFQRDRARVPGVQAAIRVGDELLWSVALGVSDVASGAPLTTEHLFHIASHSKTFTATAVLQLVEAGRLHLDDTAASWVPELADAPLGRATVRELLGHLSGINRDSDAADFWALAYPFPDDTALRERLREDATFGPNEHFKYSNMGYGLLGLIVAAASGVFYDDYVLDHIVRPLGLANLGPEVPDDRVADLAGAHSARFLGSDEPAVLPHVGSGALASATGFYGTAEDTTAYLAAHAFGREELLSDASKRLMQRRESTITRGVTRHYGLGLIEREVGGRTLVGHSGGWPGHITQSWLDPDTGLTVSVFTNILGGNATEWATALVGWVDLIEDAPEGHAVPDGVDAASFTGRYANLWGVTDVALLGGRLVALDPTSTSPQDAAVELRVADPDTLVPDPEDGFGAVGEPLRFNRDAAGRVTSVVQGGTSYPWDDFRARPLPAEAPRA